MLCDLDALLGDARRRSIKYRWLARVFDIRSIPRDYAEEIAVLANTPGISLGHIAAWMCWYPGFVDKIIIPIVEAFPDAARLGEANAASITLEDGRDMLIAGYIGHRQGFGKDGMPIYGTMWLQTRWRDGDGATLREIAAELGMGMSVEAVVGWKHENGFRPLGRVGK